MMFTVIHGHGGEKFKYSPSRDIQMNARGSCRELRHRLVNHSKHNSQ